MSMGVCSHHEEKLLTRWKKNVLSNKYNKQKKLTCSLHKVRQFTIIITLLQSQIVHDQGGRPVTTRRLNKEDILSILSSTGKFFHVGTGQSFIDCLLNFELSVAVCRAHEEIIRAQNWNALVFDADNEENEDKVSVYD